MGEGMDAGRRELAERHMGLVEEALGRTAGLRENEDARAAGNLGLCRAAALWQPRDGKFAAFARGKIAEEIGRCLWETRPLAGEGPFREPCGEEEGYRRVEERLFIAAADAALSGLVDRTAALAGRLRLRGFSVRAVAVRLGVSRRAARRALRRDVRALRRWQAGRDGKAEGGRGTDGRDSLD